VVASVNKTYSEIKDLRNDCRHLHNDGSHQIVILLYLCWGKFYAGEFYGKE
jgi:hypothetical protein